MFPLLARTDQHFSVKSEVSIGNYSKTIGAIDLKIEHKASPDIRNNILKAQLCKIISSCFYIFIQRSVNLQSADTNHITRLHESYPLVFSELNSVH